MSYRVDNVPIIIRPFFWVYSFVVGTFLFGLVVFLHFTCRIKWEGKENIPDGPKIWCLWHHGWWPYFVARPFYYGKNDRELWLNHALAYMKPIHVMADLMGIKYILALPGEEGKQAVADVVGWLKKGGSTSISPDGPAGPRRELKKGVLVMALKSGAPILPVGFEATHAIPIPSWDEKRIPLPFSKVVVKVGKPISVSDSNLDSAGAIVTQSLNELD